MSKRYSAVRSGVATLLLLAAGLAASASVAASVVSAQTPRPPADPPTSRSASRDTLPPRVSLGGTLMVGHPVGELDRYLNDMPGGSLDLVTRMDRRGVFGLRAEAGLLQYGSEKSRVMLSPTIGGRVLGDLRTTNMIIYAGVGPQLVAPTRAVRPYLDATVGVAYFATVSSISGDNNSSAFASDTNYDDATFAWGAGTGLYIPLSHGHTPWSLDLGVRYHANGRASYLREGDIQDLPDGSITFAPIHSGANLVSFHLGVSVGLRGH